MQMSASTRDLLVEVASVVDECLESDNLADCREEIDEVVSRVNLALVDDEAARDEDLEDEWADEDEGDEDVVVGVEAVRDVHIHIH